MHPMAAASVITVTVATGSIAAAAHIIPSYPPGDANV